MTAFDRVTPRGHSGSASISSSSFETKSVWIVGHQAYQTPDLWQVTARLDNAPEPELYFLVRWRPPRHFTMVNISDKPFARRNQEDREADQWRTLFSKQDWRY